jgi:hypothetical protein
MSRPLAFALTLGAFAAPLIAQPVRPLSKPDAEFSEPFSALTNVRELRDGRVVATDIRDKTVQVIDLKGNSARAVGREGSGPNEFGMPMRLVGLQGDTTAVYDPLNGRYFVVSPAGTAGGTFTLGMEDVTTTSNAPAPGGGVRMMRVGGLNMPGGSDARGRIYFKGQPFTMGPDGPTQADSSPIFRYDRATKKTDTLGYVWNGAAATVSGSRNEMRVQIGVKPFAAADEWGVLPDGRVAVVRARQYRVDVLGGPTMVRGAVQNVAAIPVTEADKVEWREQRKRATPVMITRSEGPGGNRVQTGAGPQVRMAEPSEWPATKGPFVSSTMMVAPNGQTWVQRSRKAGDQVPVYDVFNASGALVDRISLPAEHRVVGFGNATVYTVRRDSDDLQYLQRHRMP